MSTTNSCASVASGFARFELVAPAEPSDITCAGVCARIDSASALAALNELFSAGTLIVRAGGREADLLPTPCRRLVCFAKVDEMAPADRARFPILPAQGSRASHHAILSPIDARDITLSGRGFLGGGRARAVRWPCAREIGMSRASGTQ